MVIGIDWGTSSLRAYRIGADGAVLDRREEAAGILKVPNGDFAAALRKAAGDWMEAMPDAPVLLSGMIGSRQGWEEVPYVRCPAGLAEIAAGVRSIVAEGGRRLTFVPGVVAEPAGAPPDVMRGEEVQLLGCGGDGLYGLPGTHSKWVVVRGGRIASFQTHMTGELYDVLVRHSILGRLMPAGAPHDTDAFALGMARAGDAGGLQHLLFGVRTLGLTGRLAGAALPSYLSGLLIGQEIGHALSLVRPDEPVTLVGAPRLCALYQTALAARGRRAATAHPDAAAAGLYRLARHLFPA